MAGDPDSREAISAAKELMQAGLTVAITSAFLRKPKVTATFKQAVSVAKEGQQRGFSRQELSSAIERTGVLESVKAQGGDVKKAESLILQKAQIDNADQQFPSSAQRDHHMDRQEER